MPRPRESLNSVKTRLALEQQIRTDRRIQALLHPRLTGQDAEVFDDSEEEDRLIGRRERAKRDQAGKTDTSVCFCFVGVNLCLLSPLPSDKWQAKDGRVKVKRQSDKALDKEKDSVPDPLKPQDQ